MNHGQSMKYNRTFATLQKTIDEIKLIGKEIEICQVDCTITTHGDTKALSISTKNIKKLSNKKSNQEIKSEASPTLKL